MRWRGTAIFVMVSSLLEGKDMETMGFKLFFLGGSYWQSRQQTASSPSLAVGVGDPSWYYCSPPQLKMSVTLN